MDLSKYNILCRACEHEFKHINKLGQLIISFESVPLKDKYKQGILPICPICGSTNLILICPEFERLTKTKLYKHILKLKTFIEKTEFESLFAKHTLARIMLNALLDPLDPKNLEKDILQRRWNSLIRFMLNQVGEKELEKRINNFDTKFSELLNKA